MSELVDKKLIIDGRKRPEGTHSRIYNTSLKEVSVLYNDREPVGFDILVEKRSNGKLITIADTHRSSDPLHFVLLHPYGHDGWHSDLIYANGEDRSTCQDKVTSYSKIAMCEFYRYHLHSRSNHFNYLLCSGRLLQEKCCVDFARAEAYRLNWVRKNQQRLRADTYNNIVDTLRRDDVDLNSTGRLVLPASFIGSDRDKHRRFQDCTAVLRSLQTTLDYFITVTCNPNWREIIDNRLPGQKPEDRPDIIARVFSLKLDAFINEIRQEKIFGKCLAYFCSIEFQKRGLPHAHILLTMDFRHKIRTPEDVDRVICAELPPDPKQYLENSPERMQAERLEKIVSEQMIHGPCGVFNPHCPCMYDLNGHTTPNCSKHFTKRFHSFTSWNCENGSPVYRRRSPTEGGRTITKKNGITIDNSWVVPYNPYLLLRFNAHINVEICGTEAAAKCIFKYINKGTDRAMVAVTDVSLENDEIKRYQDYRSIGSCEGAYRLFGNEIALRYPAVVVLRVHLKEQQMVTYNTENDIAQTLEAARKTELTEFFEFNKQHPETKVTFADFHSFG